MIEKLIEERQQLQSRLDWLGLRSTGYDRIEKRIREIDGYIEGYYKRFKPPDEAIQAS